MTDNNKVTLYINYALLKIQTASQNTNKDYIKEPHLSPFTRVCTTELLELVNNTLGHVNPEMKKQVSKWTSREDKVYQGKTVWNCAIFHVFYHNSNGFCLINENIDKTEEKTKRNREEMKRNEQETKCEKLTSWPVCSVWTDLSRPEAAARDRNARRQFKCS